RTSRRSRPRPTAGRATLSLHDALPIFEVADRILRQPPAPALDVAVDDPREQEADGLAHLADGRLDELLVGPLECGDVSRPADRGPEEEHVPGGRTDPAPLVRAEGARLDRAPVRRRHEEPRAGQLPA